MVTAPTPRSLLGPNGGFMMQPSDFEELNIYIIGVVKKSTLADDANKAIDMLKNDSYEFNRGFDGVVRFDIDQALVDVLQRAADDYDKLKTACQTFCDEYGDCIPRVYESVIDIATQAEAQYGQLFADLEALADDSTSPIAEIEALEFNDLVTHIEDVIGLATRLVSGLKDFESSIKTLQPDLSGALTEIRKRSGPFTHHVNFGPIDINIPYVHDHGIVTDQTIQDIVFLDWEWGQAIHHVEGLVSGWSAVKDDLYAVSQAVKDDNKDTIKEILDVDRDDIVRQWADLAKEVKQIVGRPDGPDRMFGYTNGLRNMELAQGRIGGPPRRS